MKFKSEFLNELEWRGFLSQITHEKELDEEFVSGAVKAYIGFDCTADCLHVGSLIQIMILRLLQKYGHESIVLLGGGTTKIGDPSGKDESRKVLTDGQIGENMAGIHGVLAKFIDFDKGTSLVNNDDWLKDLNYIDFLRDFGRHFSVNRMLTFDSVKLRLDRDQSLSFLEFNYMILQAYDFYVLNKERGCNLQIGGSDQWGNIVNGVDLTRRVNASEGNEGFVSSFGLTTPLLTTSDGKKMGKTADGALWLDESKVGAYDYFQYFRNVSDEDVIKFIKLFTDLSFEEISELEKLEGQGLNKAKEVLAYEACKICHGQVAADESLEKARQIFLNKNSAAFVEKQVDFSDGEKKLVQIMKELGSCGSNSEARRLIEGGGVKVNGEAVKDVNLAFGEAGFEMSVGKKKFYKVLAV